MAAVQLSRGAEKDVAEADGSLKSAIFQGLKKLQTSPDKRGEPLHEELDGLRKLVVGSRNLRIIYKYFADTNSVRVIAIGRRRDEEVCRLAASRLSQLEDPQ
jgi:mRNA-degrading endonuclease RelE of RelBE toxin-antitoxin system